MSGRRWTLGPLAWGAMSLLACSSRCGASAEVTADAARTTALASPRTLPLPSNAIPVPLVRQKVSYSCGDVAALALLRYWDPADYARRTESDLYAPLHTTPSDGTDPQPIVLYMGTVPGLAAELRLGVTLGDLTSAIDRGEPVIVDLQAWKDEPRVPETSEWAADWDDGHYAVLVAYDARELYFMDPSTSLHYAYVPRDELDSRWHDVLTGSNQHIDHAAIFVHAAGRAAPSSVAATADDATRML